jgi:hypothetical protein
MSTTRSQIRKMDDVALIHTLKVNERLLESAKAQGNRASAELLERTMRELNTELTRREALEATHAAP